MVTLEQFSFISLGFSVGFGLVWLFLKISKGMGNTHNPKPRVVKHFCPICGHYHSKPNYQPANS